jgi:hypothetical protein
MSMQQICRRDGVDLQSKRLPQVGLERQLQRGHQGIGALVVIRPIHDDGARGLRHQIKHPLRHLLIERRQDGQQILLTSLLDKGLQGIDCGIRVPMVMATGVDQMNQIPRQRIRS